MEEKPTVVEAVFEKAEAYAKTSIDLFKLKTVDVMSTAAANAVAVIAVSIAFTIFFILANIGLAIWIGVLLGNTYYGFFCVAGFYLLVGIILFAFRDKIIKKPISDAIINQVLD